MSPDTADASSLRPTPAQLLGDHVVEQLRTAILRGHFPQGSHLREADLATRLSVSRGPIRVALSSLEQEGLVRSRPHRGVLVTQLTARDVEEIYGLRRVLEVLAVEQAVGKATPADFAEMHRVLADLEGAWDKADLVEVSHLDVAFHDLLYRAAGHSRLYKAWQNLRSQVTLFLVSRNTLAPTDREIVIDEHAEIVASLAAGDAERTRRLIEAHLEGAYERLRTSLPASSSEED